MILGAHGLYAFVERLAEGSFRRRHTGRGRLQREVHLGSGAEADLDLVLGDAGFALGAHEVGAGLQAHLDELALLVGLDLALQVDAALELDGDGSLVDRLALAVDDLALDLAGRLGGSRDPGGDER